MAPHRPRTGLLSRLVRPLAAMLGGRGEAAAPAKKAVASPQSDTLVDDAFTLEMQSLLIEDEGKFQVKLQVISLVEFHEAVGDKWQKVRDKVMMIAEGVIHQHLGVGNTCGRQGDDFFVLLFRTFPAAEGRRRALQIAQELGTRLVGDQFIGLERPLALAVEVPLSTSIKADGSLDLDCLDDAVEQCRSLIPAAKTQEDVRPPISGATDDNGPKQVKPPTWKAVDETRSRKEGVDPDWQAMNGGKSLADIPLELIPSMPGDARLSLLWRPTWVAAGEAIGAYYALVQRVDRPEQPALEGCRAYARDGGETAQALDRFVIGAAVREMKAAEQAATGATIIVPLHWTSVGTSRRMGLMVPFADLPETARASRLVIELFGVPGDVHPTLLTETITALQSLCREVLLRVPLAFPHAALAAQCGGAMIGVDLGELPSDERTDDDGLLDGLGGLAQNAATAGRGAYVWGVRRRKVVIGVVQGGFAMMNGPGLMKELPRPAKVLPAPRSRFFGGGR
ncbi:conserved hypothetical protein [Candidatus Terasakiella magnetica]|nr:conserved hypothetical protein [Candidatus Terasakiella magnetica]